MLFGSECGCRGLARVFKCPSDRLLWSAGRVDWPTRGRLWRLEMHMNMLLWAPTRLAAVWAVMKGWCSRGENRLCAKCCSQPPKSKCCTQMPVSTHAASAIFEPVAYSSYSNSEVLQSPLGSLRPTHHHQVITSHPGPFAPGSAPSPTPRRPTSPEPDTTRSHGRADADWVQQAVRGLQPAVPPHQHRPRLRHDLHHLLPPRRREGTRPPALLALWPHVHRRELHPEVGRAAQGGRDGCASRTTAQAQQLALRCCAHVCHAHTTATAAAAGAATPQQVADHTERSECAATAPSLHALPSCLSPPAALVFCPPLPRASHCPLNPPICALPLQQASHSSPRTRPRAASTCRARPTAGTLASAPASTSTPPRRSGAIGACACGLT